MVYDVQKVLKREMLPPIRLQRVNLQHPRTFNFHNACLRTYQLLSSTLQDLNMSHYYLGCRGFDVHVGGAHQLCDDVHGIWCGKLKTSHNHNLSYLLFAHALVLALCGICA